MKLKILSVFLALGMFVLGAEVSAQEESNAPESGAPIYCSKTPITKWSAVQKALDSLIKGDETKEKVIQKGCTKLSLALKAGKGVTQPIVMACETALNDQKADPDVSKMVKAVLLGACAALCSGPGGKIIKYCDTCNKTNHPQTYALCGGLCCNVSGGETALKTLGCMTDFPKGDCSSFKATK